VGTLRKINEILSRALCAVLLFAPKDWVGVQDTQRSSLPTTGEVSPTMTGRFLAASDIPQEAAGDFQECPSKFFLFF
jgi:hypothetical protein